MPRLLPWLGMLPRLRLLRRLLRLLPLLLRRHELLRLELRRLLPLLLRRLELLRLQWLDLQVHRLRLRGLLRLLLPRLRLVLPLLMLLLKLLLLRLSRPTIHLRLRPTIHLGSGRANIFRGPTPQVLELLAEFPQLRRLRRVRVRHTPRRFPPATCSRGGHWRRQPDGQWSWRGYGSGGLEVLAGPSPSGLCDGCDGTYMCVPMHVLDG